MSVLYSTESAECCPAQHQICRPASQESMQFPPAVKVNQVLRTLCVYRIPCECGKVYIGQTGRSVDTRLKDHQRHIRLEHPDKSTVAQHSVDLGHRIQFHNTSILATQTQYMDRIVRKAIKTELHPNNMNRVAGFCLGKSWKTPLCSLKKPP
jgi:predicted GIY-YIG superfamily endonuclease